MSTIKIILWMMLSLELVIGHQGIPTTEPAIDPSTLQYRPILYSEADLVDYNFHAFLVFDHPIVTDTQYLNIRVKNLGNGEETGAWLVRNIPIAPTFDPRPVHYRMNLFGISDGVGCPEVVEYDVLCGDYQLDSLFEAQSTIIPPTLPVEHHVPPGIQHIHTDVLIPYFGPIFIPPILPDTLYIVARGCTVPNIDLDSLVHGDNDTDEIDDSDWNACGPAAAANSLRWLMESHPSIPIVDSLRGILDTMKKYASKDADGTFWDSIVSAKLRFIDKHMLPIHVKYQVHTPYPGFKQEIKSPNKTYGHKAENQTGEDGIPTFEWLCEELAKGEDVEMGIQYWCKSETNPDSMVRAGSHYVNLTGYAVAGGDTWLMWKHDIWQQTPEGTVEEWGKLGKAKKPDDESEDPDLYPMLSEMSYTEEGCVAFLADAISESYDPEVTFCTKTVTNTSDSGPGSLRHAIDCNPAGATIKISPDLDGDTIVVSGEDLVVDKELKIEAPEGVDIKIKFETEKGFIVEEDGELELDGVDIISGTGETGSAIDNSGETTLRNVDVFDNDGVPGTGVLIDNKGEMHIEGETNLKKE